MQKKGQAGGLSGLIGVGIAFVVLAVTLGMGGVILEKLKDQLVSNSSGANSTDAGLESLGTIADFLPTVAITVVAAVIIGLILKFFRQ